MINVFGRRIYLGRNFLNNFEEIRVEALRHAALRIVTRLLFRRGGVTAGGTFGLVLPQSDVANDLAGLVVHQLQVLDGGRLEGVLDRSGVLPLLHGLVGPVLDDEPVDAEGELAGVDEVRQGRQIRLFDGDEGLCRRHGAYFTEYTEYTEYRLVLLVVQCGDDDVSDALEYRTRNLLSYLKKRSKPGFKIYAWDRVGIIMRFVRVTGL